MRRKTTKKADLPQSQIAAHLLSEGLFKACRTALSLCTLQLLGTPATGELGVMGDARGGFVALSLPWITGEGVGVRTRFN